MSVRLVITAQAQPGKGAELAQAMKNYCQSAQTEPGCEQFELFQSVHDTDKLIVLELWSDQAALDAHAERNARHPPAIAGDLRAAGQREDYTYHRTR